MISENVSKVAVIGAFPDLFSSPHTKGFLCHGRDHMCVPRPGHGNPASLDCSRRGCAVPLT